MRPNARKEAIPTHKANCLKPSPVSVFAAPNAARA